MNAELYCETTKEMVEAWDNGKSIWTVEMGGLGPGYEQAIQVLMVEMCRVALDTPRNEGETDEEWGERITTLSEEVIHGLDKSCGGFSGAQVGAARNLAGKFIFNGPRKSLVNFHEQVEDAEDRMIQASNHWPKATQSIAPLEEGPK